MLARAQITALSFAKTNAVMIALKQSARSKQPSHSMITLVLIDVLQMVMDLGIARIGVDKIFAVLLTKNRAVFSKAPMSQQSSLLLRN